MNIKILTTILAAACIFPATGMSREARRQYQAITGDTTLIWGEGSGGTQSAADQAALYGLASKITTTVTGSFTAEEAETTAGGAVTASSGTYASMVKSYSGATLHDAEYMLLETEPEFRVLRYMKRSAMEKIFADRTDRVLEYVRTALQAEKKLKIDEALRSLNRAYILLNSLRSPAKVTADIDGESRVLVNYIPEHMREICGKVKFGVASTNADGTVYLTVDYDGQPVSGLDFKFFTGRNWSSIVAAKDGRAELELDGSNLEKLQVEIEYEYRGECNSDKDLAPLVDAFDGLAIRNSLVTLSESPKLKADKKARREFDSYVSNTAADAAEKLTNTEATDYSTTMAMVVSAVQTHNLAAARTAFSDSGWEMFNSLLGYGNARIVGKPVYSFHPLGERVVCRSVPMSFSFPGSGRKFLEDVTFTFGADGLIESLAFSLSNDARRDIFGRGGEAWTDQTKMTIVSFLENYKTAFALKRGDYLESIFDDNAYIIVGHVVHRMEKTDRGDGQYTLTAKDEVNYARKSKKEYLNNLRRSFAANEFINIRFTDTDVVKAAFGGETFGIQIKQEYNSSNYADMGYLFLMVDLNEADKPIIQVRTWQPERNPDITPNLPKTSRDYGIFSTASFN